MITVQNFEISIILVCLINKLLHVSKERMFCVWVTVSLWYEIVVDSVNCDVLSRHPTIYTSLHGTTFINPPHVHLMLMMEWKGHEDSQIINLLSRSRLFVCTQLSWFWFTFMHYCEMELESYFWTIIYHRVPPIPLNVSLFIAPHPTRSPSATAAAAPPPHAPPSLLWLMCGR